MTNKWTNAEVKFIETRINAGVHPKDFLNELNEKYKTGRTYEAIENKCRRLNLTYGHLKSKTFLECASQEGLKQQIKFDREREQLISQLNTFKRLYHAAIGDGSLQDKLLTTTKELIRALPVVPPPKIIVPNISKKDITHESVLLLLSDLHAGEVVAAEEVNGINAYNTNIMCNRLKFLASHMTDIVVNKLTGYQFDKLVIAGLGDWVSGIIHEELIESAEGNVVEWTFGVALIVAQFISELAQIFPKIEFVGVVGNHGRLHKKPRFKTRYVNWDYFAYQILSLLLANQPNVTFKIPKSFWTLHEISGHNFLFLHGDNINSYASIPWYGIERTVSKLKELLEANSEQFDYICMGHFHTRNILDRVKGELIINGSLIGGNEYSIGRLFTSSLASQHLCGVHKKYGCTWNYKVKVQYAPTNATPTYIYGVDGALSDVVRNSLTKMK